MKTNHNRKLVQNHSLVIPLDFGTGQAEGTNIWGPSLLDLERQLNDQFLDSEKT